jgi:hypothetical protein
MGDPISWKAGYVASPPNFMTKKTRKGRTILNPRVPTKLTNIV